jgi:hypothetical protein
VHHGTTGTHQVSFGKRKNIPEASHQIPELWHRHYKQNNPKIKTGDDYLKNAVAPVSTILGKKGPFMKKNRK